MSRWTDYFMDEDFSGFWSRRARGDAVRILVILGVGFDPRCLRALQLLAQLGIEKRLSYLALRLVANPTLGEQGALVARLAQENMDKLLKGRGYQSEGNIDVEMRDPEGHNVVGRKTLSAVSRAMPDLSSFTDVIVDISGMPRGVFFPLIAYLLRLADSNTIANLHVAIVEDPQLDARIAGQEYGQADYLHTFRFQGGDRIIWLPAIGIDDAIRLEKIHDRLKAACVEICPVLPFPASSLRRVDDIAVAHSEQLFEGFLVSMDDLLLCDERTPFDIYRKILEVEEYYRKSLARIPSIGNVTTVLSPLSSKTLSLGMLLAAVERRLPVCHVEAGAYQLRLDAEGAFLPSGGARPSEIWLAGEPYSA